MAALAGNGAGNDIIASRIHQEFHHESIRNSITGGSPNSQQDNEPKIIINLSKIEDFTKETFGVFPRRGENTESREVTLGPTFLNK